MDPAVVVLSYGGRSPTSIVNQINELNGDKDESHEMKFDAVTVKSYPYLNKTKYYENNLMLIPFDDDIESLPSELIKITESFIVYFDGVNRSFLKEIPALCTLLEEHKIELGLLLTDQLHDESRTGLTYKEVKTICNMHFDIIELKAESEDCEDDDERHEYSEIHNALQNHIWSNVKHPKLKENDESEGAGNMEEQLELFEELLMSLQMFKKVSSTLEREEVLNQAEKFAEIFTNIVNEDLD